MYTIYKNTLYQLLPAERKRFFLWAIADACIALLDITLLAGLLALADFFINPANTTKHLLQPFFSNYGMAPAALALLLLFVIKNAAAYAAASAQYRFAYTVAARLSEKRMAQFLNGSYRRYAETDTAVHIKSISQQPVEFAHYVLNGWQQIITQVLLLLFTITVILFFDPFLFLLLVLLLLPPLFIALYTAKRKTAQIKSGIQSGSENALQYLKEALAGFTESNLYAKNDFFSKRYSAKQFLLNRRLSQLQVLQALPARLMELFAVAGFVLLVLLSNTGTFTVPFFTAGALMAAAYKIIPGVAKIINNAALIKTYAYTTTAKDESIQNKGNAVAADSLTAIAWSNLSFAYKQPVLQQFSSSIQAGDFAGIAAGSGKGKTTLINILLGFEEEQEGTVLFNGTAVTATQRRQYWSQIAYVKQQPFLLYDTVANNITLDDAPADTALLNRVADITGISQWLKNSKEGLQTMITENGKNISGGQRQRIAIARALYKNAAVIILDETFSELDTASENKLLEYFKQLAQEGKIVLLITHNTGSLSYCNKIIRIDAA
jgi:ABC-type multidrug transport system fused ATPase/permease subunit